MVSLDALGSFMCRGAASLIVVVGLSLITFYRDTYHMDGRDVKWVLLRGLTAALSYMLNVCAVQLDVQEVPCEKPINIKDT